MDIRRRNLMGQVPITANVTIENVKGSWGESSKTVSGYRVYESKGSYNVNYGYDLAKRTFSGYPQFTFLYGSYAESSYDFVVISKLDDASAANWTYSSYSNSLLTTSGKQSSSAPNLSYTFTNDGGEHFFYILYRKDGSVNSGADRGYIAFRQANYLEVSQETFVLNHRTQTCNIDINTDQNYNISVDSDFITYSTTSTGIAFTVDANLSADIRQGVITISSDIKTVSIQITQNAYDLFIDDRINVSYGSNTLLSIEAEQEISIENNNDWFQVQTTEGTIGTNLIIEVLSESETDRSGTFIVISGHVRKEVTVINLLFSGVIIEFTDAASGSGDGLFYLEHNYGMNEYYKIGTNGNQVNLSSSTGNNNMYYQFSLSSLYGNSLYVSMSEDRPSLPKSQKGIKRRDRDIKCIDCTNIPSKSKFYLWSSLNFRQLEEIKFPSEFKNQAIDLQVAKTGSPIIINSTTKCILNLYSSSGIQFEPAVYSDIAFYVYNSSSASWLANTIPETSNGYVIVGDNYQLSTSPQNIFQSKGYTIVHLATWTDVYNYNFFN